MHAIAHGGIRTPREILHRKLTVRKEYLAAPGESNMRQWRAGPTLCQWSYIPTHCTRTFMYVA